MKAKLIERGASPQQTREIPLNQDEFLIGRGADCDLRLRAPSISRHHCLIRLGPDEASVLDLGSSNGTYVNGQRVRSQATLHTGDELQVGTFHFVVELDDQGPVAEASGPGEDPLAATMKLPPQELKRRPGLTPPSEGSPGP
jgi:pSer/pThr/pTyr-binding forkhead associated (FHA) protein